MVTTVPSQRLGTDFQLLEEGADQSWVRVRFDGPFAGQQITWDATFRIRTAHCAHNAIEIGAVGKDGRALTVTLALSRFDLPAIRKTVIMIRQYKRLREGRIEFG